MLDVHSELRHTGVVKFGPGTSAGTAATAAPSLNAAPAASTEGQTRAAVVRLLLESGPITAGEIGERLGLSAAGVRRHLDALIDAGDAVAHPAAAWQHHGRGRPAKRFQLTADGRAKLNHAYDDLASAAMRQLREIGGDEAVRTFARRRIDTILGDLTIGAPQDDLPAAVGQVADALTRAGYAASTQKVGGSGGFLQGVQICQHHCPVSHVAAEFPELCEAEQQAFAAVLGTHVQRLATIANGDCACTTHVPMQTSPPA